MSKLPLSPPSLSAVYQLADRFRDASPWKWMTDEEIFAVQSPLSGKIAYCCIMGNAGVTYGLAIYDGNKGLQTLGNLVSSHLLEEIDRIKVNFEQEAYHVIFENEDYISKEDKAVYKKLGLMFRGKNQWVKISEWRPGYLPVTVQEDNIDMDLIAFALEQALEVVELFKKDPVVLGIVENELLLRLPVVKNDQIEWINQYMVLPDVEEEDLSAFINKDLVEKAKKLPIKKSSICFSLLYMPKPVDIQKGDPETQPFFAKMAFWMERDSGSVLSIKVYSPKTFKQDFVKDIFAQLHEFGHIHSRIIVPSDFAYDLLTTMLSGLKTEVVFDPNLEVFENLHSAFTNDLDDRDG